MALTDLHLRQFPKAQETDLWLHPAGPESGAPGDVTLDAPAIRSEAHVATHAIAIQVDTPSGIAWATVNTPTVLIEQSVEVPSIQATAVVGEPAIEIVIEAPKMRSATSVQTADVALTVTGERSEARAVINPPTIVIGDTVDAPRVVAEAQLNPPSIFNSSTPVQPPPPQSFPTGVAGGGSGVGGWKRNPSLWDTLTVDVELEAPAVIAHAKMVPPAFVMIDGLTSGFNEEEDEELVILALHHFDMI